MLGQELTSLKQDEAGDLGALGAERQGGLGLLDGALGAAEIAGAAQGVSEVGEGLRLEVEEEGFRVAVGVDRIGAEHRELGDLDRTLGVGREPGAGGGDEPLDERAGEKAPGGEHVHPATAIGDHDELLRQGRDGFFQLRLGRPLVGPGDLGKKVFPGLGEGGESAAAIRAAPADDVADGGHDDLAKLRQRGGVEPGAEAPSDPAGRGHLGAV